MVDFIIVAVIVVIIGVAVTYIRKAKKSGVKCIGCPSGGNCCSGECNCHADAKE